MKLHISLTQLAAITNGKLRSSQPQRELLSFVTDSRVIAPGDSFWALKGALHDGHEFIATAVEKGATLIIGEEGAVPNLPDTVSVLTVKNSLRALQELAKYHRLHHALKVAAITGSNGKSTTKQMLKSICSQAGETIANMGNFNNQFGVPFSLLEIQPKHQYGVFELGASHPGDIAETAQLVVPNVAVLTNVSAAHLEHFKDLQTVYRTKTELVDYIAPGGTLVYNSDDKMLCQLAAHKGNKIGFGFNPQADLQILEDEFFTFMYQGKKYKIEVKLQRHDRLNAAAACAAAIGLGIGFEQITQGLLTFTPMPMRMEHVKHGKAELILDCYNANPASMQNALHILGQITAHPRIAVLGDMKELGETSAQFHALIAQWLQENQIEYAFLAGAEMKHAAAALPADGPVQFHYGLTPQAWTPTLKELLAQQGGVCLLKASRGMQFENILKEI